MNLLEALEEVKWREVPDKAVEVYQKYAHVFEQEWEKEGTSPTLNTLAQYINLIPGEYPGGIPNSPSPLASMLVGGLAGAGLGYGAGWLGEKVLPPHWERNKLRRTAAMLGGALGAAPGALWGGLNLATDRGFNSDELFQEAAPTSVPESYDFGGRIETGFELPKEAQEELRNAFTKVADLYPGTGLFGPAIDVQDFNQTIWNDPRVAGNLPVSTRAAATGLVTGAANLPGKRETNFVTPVDVARMAAGMGSGYLSGMLVGKALGIMAGMPQQTQDHLKNTGMWAGLVANLIPIAFGA